MAIKKEKTYSARIQRALIYIDEHLSEEISVAKLAEVSHFSAYHFHRIFKSVTGESPYESILRLRLEKALFYLKYNKGLELNTVSSKCGFGSYENFSRQFKARFGISPNAYKNGEQLENSRIYQDNQFGDAYPRGADAKVSTAIEVVIEELPAIRIALVRAIFGSDGSELVRKYQELITWAEESGIEYQGPNRRFGMSIDSMESTPSAVYRYDFCLNIDRLDTAPVEGISFGKIPAGKYATVHCIGKLADLTEAWNHLYQHWLPSSGYIPRDYPAVEEFIQGPEEIGWENFNIKCRIPLIKL